MKQLSDFLEKIRSLPEEGRKLLAIILFVLSAMLIFFVWSASMSSRISSVIQEKPLASQTPEAVRQERPQEEETALGPLAGVTESLRSIKNVASVMSFHRGEVKEAGKLLQKTGETFNTVLNKIANYLYSY